MIKGRFAPSPTGFLHIGGARTCLFSWLFVRKNQGRFVLRIEDTDRGRSKKEYLEEILESLKWLGMDWDELYCQSDRFDLYSEHAQKLLDNNKAYKKEGAVFFKYDFEQVCIEDTIRGNIKFTELPKEEEVIIKSDGSPTYNFSCVVDDGLMGINYVVRGEDHISNTPKQILIYKALGLPVPNFAHLPLILSEAGGRMSKRFGATSIREYREQGFLSEAVVNYLLLLGWSPGKGEEVFSLKEAKDKFLLDRINKTSASFSMDKFRWINSEHLKTRSAESLCQPISEVLTKKGFKSENIDKNYLIKAIEVFKDRISTLSEFADWADFCFLEKVSYQADTREILDKKVPEELKKLVQVLSNAEKFDKHNIEEKFRGLCNELKIKAKVLVHPTRVALTGRKIGPGLFETMELLGKDRVLDRMNSLIYYWEGKNE